jgi:hypothetical protein
VTDEPHRPMQSATRWRDGTPVSSRYGNAPRTFHPRAAVLDEPQSPTAPPTTGASTDRGRGSSSTSAEELPTS